MRSFLTGTLVAAATLSGSSGASAGCVKTRDNLCQYSSTNGTASSSSSSSYDYIVVGGGPAGIIAATRLAQNTPKSVLLISRGPGPTLDTGAVVTVGWNDSLVPIDVPGLTTEVKSYEASEGNETLLSSYLCDDVIDSKAYCVLGGAASINPMVFPYIPDHDFDDKWPAGWKWSDVSDAADRVWALNPGSALPSKDGQLYDQDLYDTVSQYLDVHGWTSVNSSEDRNLKTKVYSHPHWDIGNTLRAGPVRSYLPLAVAEDNFSYQLNATVRRVLRNGGTVTGVEYADDITGTVGHIGLREGGKVILAAGAWNTPRILFNSGIGPAEQIQTVANGTSGIAVPPRADWIELPVGQGIKDHPDFTLYVQTSGNWTLYNYTAVADGTDTAAIALYEQQGSGVLTQGSHRLLFWTSNVAAADNGTRYYQGSVSPKTDGMFLIKAYMTHGATSSGTMGIQANGSVAYTQLPYLRTAGDVEGATRFVEDLLRELGAYEDWAIADGYDNDTAALLADYHQGDHFVGSAVLGTDAASSVVSADDLHVWGTANLFVVDASIHADLPTGNTQPIVMVVAEKAVEKILAAE